MKVTGPEGNNPITDDQIRELRMMTGWLGAAAADQQVISVALDSKGLASDSQRRRAREQCAEAWNARHETKCQGCGESMVAGPTSRDVERFERRMCGACEETRARHGAKP